MQCCAGRSNRHGVGEVLRQVTGNHESESTQLFFLGSPGTSKATKLKQALDIKLTRKKIKVFPNKQSNGRMNKKIVLH
jgi:hypothetical protein